ncbi:Peptidase S9, prolyl oligopeptidase active site region domain protein [Candidatus Magnetoovum chiemensis]|nr:Peptidase S9, prolyl oligopeptidase active site region domain protein [Candidatus Magnetoovum chiemensis]
MRNILLIVAFISFSDIKSIESEIVIKQWKIAGPFLAAPGDGVIDYLTLQAGENHITPSDNQYFYSPLVKHGKLKWFTINTESEEASIEFKNADYPSVKQRYGQIATLAVTYAYGEINMEQTKRALIALSNVPSFYLNGKRYGGEPYSYNYVKIPAVLQKGTNKILLKLAGKGDLKFSFKFIPIETDITILSDYTKPDIIDGEIAKNLFFSASIVNTTEKWLNDIKIKIKKNKLFKEAVVELYPLAPYSIIKTPIDLEMYEPASIEDKNVNLDIDVMNKTSIVYSAAVPLDIKNNNDVIKKTFTSEIDSSVQYYSIRYPSDFNKDKKYGVIFTLHGAGVESDTHLSGHAQRSDVFIAAPTNRRPFGFDWQDIGRADFQEVYSIIMNTYNIDKSRVYLTGASMGGQGVWHIGLHSPSLFSSIAPNAAWTMYSLYMPDIFKRSAHFTPPKLSYIINRAQMDANNTYFLQNASNLPVILSHGSSDSIVPPVHPRIFQDLLKHYGYNIKYYEIENKPHTWKILRSDNSTLIESYDNPEVIDDLLRTTLNPYPKKVSFKLCDLTINNKFYWITVNEQENVFNDTAVNAEVEGAVIRLNTTNVASLTLNIPKELIDSDNIKIQWNDNNYSVTIDSDRTVELRQNNSRKAKRTSALYGSLKAVFFKPFVIVYGTNGSLKETELLIDNARQIAYMFWNIANGYTRIIADTAVDNSVIQNYNLILLGLPQRNAFTERIIKQLPISIDSKGISIGTQRLKKPLALNMIYPNPLNEEKYLALFAGTSLEMESLSLKFLPISSSNSAGDFIVYTKDVNTKGWGGVAAAGFFSTNWDFSNNDYYINTMN